MATARRKGQAAAIEKRLVILFQWGKAKNRTGFIRSSNLTAEFVGQTDNTLNQLYIGSQNTLAVIDVVFQPNPDMPPP